MLGSLMDGLKKRWFTERTSTLTRPPPTTPSAEPNPVMLRIISSQLSYGVATRLSIPEIPSHTVELGLPRQIISGDELVPLLKHVAELIRHHRRLHSDLQAEGDGAHVSRGDQVAVGERKPHGRAVLVRKGREQPEVAAGEAVQEVGLDVQLTARLISRPIQSSGVVPRDPPRVGVKRLEQSAPHGSGARGRLA